MKRAREGFDLQEPEGHTLANFFSDPFIGILGQCLVGVSCQGRLVQKAHAKASPNMQGPLECPELDPKSCTQIPMSRPSSNAVCFHWKSDSSAQPRTELMGFGFRVGIRMRSKYPCIGTCMLHEQTCRPRRSLQGTVVTMSDWGFGGL